jgi:hypothetical protein
MMLRHLELERTMSEPSGRQSQSTVNLEAIAHRATIGAPLAYRIFSGIGGVASTAILAIIGFAWQEVRDEWRELRKSIAEIRNDLDAQPSPEEFQRMRDKLEQVNDRLIRIEARFDE